MNFLTKLSAKTLHFISNFIVLYSNLVSIVSMFHNLQLLVITISIGNYQFKDYLKGNGKITTYVQGKTPSLIYYQ